MPCSFFFSKVWNEDEEPPRIEPAVEEFVICSFFFLVWRVLLLFGNNLGDIIGELYEPVLLYLKNLTDF